MVQCPSCKRAMIKLSYYDTEGTIPITKSKTVDGEQWVCINQGCKDCNSEMIL